MKCEKCKDTGIVREDFQNVKACTCGHFQIKMRELWGKYDKQTAGVVTGRSSGGHARPYEAERPSAPVAVENPFVDKKPFVPQLDELRKSIAAWWPSRPR